MSPVLRILLADDEEIVHQTIGDYLCECGHQLDRVYDGASALEAVEEHDYDLALVDVRMPRLDGLDLLEKAQEVRPEMSIVIITGHGRMEMVIQALRLGAADFLAKPIKLLELDAALEKALQIRELRQDKRHLREIIRGIQTSEELRSRNRRFVGDSPETRLVREQIRLAVEAGCDTILITGDTGTGKEVVAREIHFQGGPEDSPFIAVSCPALPDSLVESELFGHMKGAFTGATADRAGYFELADGGTLFLDEVADLSEAAQAKLLRALETRTFRRVGGAKEIRVDLRVVAATNSPLEALMDAGAFRQDLYYRLNVFSIDLLPLCVRPQDIVPLAEHFLAAYAGPRGFSFEGFSAEAEDVLLGYDFPGNARELRNVVERAAILCRSGWILPEHIVLPRHAGGNSVLQDIAPVGRAERGVILRALEGAKWNRRQVAKDLDMPYSTLRYKIQKLKIQ